MKALCRAKSKTEVINIRHWELLLCQALHKHLPEPVLAPSTLDVSSGKVEEVGGQDVQEKPDGAGYHNELPTFAKIPSASKEVNRKTLKADKVAFWVAFPVFTGTCNTSFDSHTTSNGGTWYCEQSNTTSVLVRGRNFLKN